MLFFAETQTDLTEALIDLQCKKFWAGVFGMAEIFPFFNHNMEKMSKQNVMAASLPQC